MQLRQFIERHGAGIGRVSLPVMLERAFVLAAGTQSGSQIYAKAHVRGGDRHRTREMLLRNLSATFLKADRAHEIEGFRMAWTRLEYLLAGASRSGAISSAETRGRRGEVFLDLRLIFQRHVS